MNSPSNPNSAADALATLESLPDAKPQSSRPAKLIRTGSPTHRWYRPIVSPEHGVYVVLLVSFLTGAAAAQNWTGATTLAFICAVCGFQAEHPLILQIRQRKSLKLRFWVWGGLCGGTAAAIALFLYFQTPSLVWIYLAAIAALLVDAVSVFQREHKSIVNELITFSAVCLSAPLADAATTGTLTPLIFGLWLLNSLFFCSSIFTVKLRKVKQPSIAPGVIYHTIATIAITGFVLLNWLPLIPALAFGIVLLKFGWIVARQQWYRDAPIQRVAALETTCAFGFLLIVCLSLLPAIR